MNRRLTFSALLSAATGVLAALSPRAGVAAPDHRAVFDLSADGAEKWDGALRNIENLRKALGPGMVEVHLIVHGKAFPLLQKSENGLESRLKALQDAGVRLSLCRNTMKRFDVPADSLLPYTDTVDAAVAELVRKQTAGWAYIKVA